jgi:Domain of unknown function (DUF1848)
MNATQLGMFEDMAVTTEQIAPDCPHGRLGRVPKRGQMIISASKRTDIPAFYLSWFMKRVEAGWVDVPNPHRPLRERLTKLERAREKREKDGVVLSASEMVAIDESYRECLTHVSLLPKDVLAIVWWSKNYGVYERFYQKFEQYENQYFHFTINPRRPGFHNELEKGVQPVEEAIRQVGFLAKLPGGPDMVAWRYDPLVFWRDVTTGELDTNWDPEFFSFMCQELTQRGVTKCFTSLADFPDPASPEISNQSKKFVLRVREFFPNTQLRYPSAQEVRDIVGEMHRIAAIHGMFVFPCTEMTMAAYGGSDGTVPGFSRAEGACIDGRLFSKKQKLHTATDSGMAGREDCACSKHLDIGDYVSQECGYGCMYCYANPNHRAYTPARW